MPFYEVEYKYDGGSGWWSFEADSASEAEYEFWDRASVANAEGCRVVRVRKKRKWHSIGGLGLPWCSF